MDSPRLLAIRSKLPAASCSDEEIRVLAREHGAAVHALLSLDSHARPTAEQVKERVESLLPLIRDGFPVDISKVPSKAKRMLTREQYHSHLQTVIGQLISWDGAREHPEALRQVLEAYLDAGFFDVNTMQAELFGHDGASLFEVAMRCDNWVAAGVFVERGADMSLVPSPGLLENLPAESRFAPGDINAMLDLFGRLAPSAARAASQALMHRAVRASTREPDRSEHTDDMDGSPATPQPRRRTGL